MAIADISELHSLVHQHCIFFDKVVELVPAKFYKADEDQQIRWHHGMSKAARAAAKQATKERLKKARRDRFDPEKFNSVSKLLQQQENCGSAEVEVKGAGLAVKGEAKRASTYEELRERLRKRIEMLRLKRHADSAAAVAKNAHNWRDQRKKDFQKQKRRKASNERSRDMFPSKRQKQTSGIMHEVAKKEEPSDVAGLEFGRVKMSSDGGDLNRRHKKRKETKEHLLAKAEKLHMEMQDPAKGQKAALKHSWNAAVSRAAGEKVLDDPKLLKWSLKKEHQHRHKSTQKWKERKETERKLAEEKQQTRSEHIRERKEQKKELKLAKRDKKLLRPGFEGRKEGFINA